MGLYGIISILDGIHDELVKDLWDAIDRTCRPRSLVPHLSPISPTHLQIDHRGSFRAIKSSVIHTARFLSADRE